MASIAAVTSATTSARRGERRDQSSISSGVASGWNWTPQLDPSRNAWLPYRAVRASSTAPSGSRTTTSWCDCATTTSPDSAPSTGSSDAAGSSSSATAPSSVPSGCPTTTWPPSAFASTWWPRHTPRIGMSMSWASATRSARSTSHGCSDAERADIVPPRITSPSPIDAIGGTSRSHRDTCESRTPASFNHPSIGPAGQRGSSWRIVTRGSLAMAAA